MRAVLVGRREESVLLYDDRSASMMDWSISGKRTAKMDLDWDGVCNPAAAADGLDWMTRRC